MATEANKAIVRRYLDAVWNGGDLALIDEAIAPAFIQHLPNVPSGRAGVKATG